MKLLHLLFVTLLSLINYNFTEAGPSSPPSVAPKITLRCADVQPDYYPTVQGVKYMGRLVNLRSRGRITIKIYTDSSLGSEQSIIEMLQLGALDMARLSTATVADIDAEVGVFVLPYLFRDDDHKWKILSGRTGRRILEGMVDYGLIGLCFQESGYRSFYNFKRPIYQPEDLRGLKMRVLPSRLMIKLIEHYGTSPVPINYGEVYSALRAGVIDGAENNTPSYFTSKHYKVAKYYSLDRHNSIPEVVVFSEKIWNRLSPSDRQLIRKAAQESVGYQRKQWAKFEAAALEKLKKEGCLVNEVNNEAFYKEVQPFYAKYAKQYQTMIDEIKRQ